ncbi:class F sortase [Corynebacterium sp. sy017]|uniref:class F sortase n=1 Tax=unclassified Corynebacterium TaxID=2624378 RepID=UPI0011850B9D|nr:MULTISPECIES: class F sortase [unclassified Corynebacterium]MBP3089200.1 class F sortase [Corynebacterium sp. sy017]TSD91091.1 class F sortase [Corynebacterium sp. SY003]
MNAQFVPEKSQKSKGILIALAAAVVVIIAVVSFIFLGKNTDSTSTQTSAASVSETTESFERPSDGYVDDSGAQQSLEAPAVGEAENVTTMSMMIAGAQAPIDFVQLTDTGTLLPPEDVSRLGWYSASAVPGSNANDGTTVITGHVNDASQGAGYAFQFTKLQLGDEISINVDGQERKFRVSIAPQHYLKGSEMPEVVNRDQGANQLVLITCGGRFVGGTLGYEDNIITVADPV